MNDFLGRERKSSTYEKNLENRIYRYPSHDGLPVAAAFRDSAEIRKFRRKNHSDNIDTDFRNCIIQPDYLKKKVESATEILIGIGLYYHKISNSISSIIIDIMDHFPLFIFFELI